MFENAKWITSRNIKEWQHPSHIDPPPSPYVVRDFDINGNEKRITLSVCGLGQAAYYLNGNRLPDSLHPTQISDYTKSTVYNEFDLTYMVKKGKNRFGAILAHSYLADPENMFRMGTPRMIAQIDIEYTSGERKSIVSNSSFFVHDSPTIFSLRRCGERYDANLVIPDWCAPESSLDSWTPASICASPGGIFRKKVCPPKRAFDVIEGKEIAKGVFDFGENLSGWVRFRLHGRHHSPITVLYSEWLTDDKKHISTDGLQPGVCPEMLHKDIYIPTGCDGEGFEPLFTFHGFRYVEIIGAEKVSVDAIKVHTDITPLSSFECNNEILNGIHKYCERSILACAQGAMLDCPQREQNEWTGDGMLTSEVISMEFDSYDLFYEWMENFKDAQFPCGSLPAIIPCRNNWPYSFANGLDWSSALIHIPYYAYKYTEDSRIVELVWDNMVRLMDYFSTRSENNLMDFGVGDWVSIEKMCPVEITDTVYYRLDALMMAELANALGKPYERWISLADDIKHDFRQKYVKDGRLTDMSFTSIVCSVYSGMLDGDEISTHVDIAARITENNGFAFRCGVHGLRMAFDVFGKYGYNELIFKVLTNTDKMGYGKFVKDGITTLPELFDYKSSDNPSGQYSSLNHHFLAMVDGWFFRYVAGIKFLGFGPKDLVISPINIRGIENFSCTSRGITVTKTNGTLAVSSPIPFTYINEGIEKRYCAGEFSFSV